MISFDNQIIIIIALIIITIVKITTITIVLMIKRTSASARRESTARFRGFPASQPSGLVGVGAPGGIFIIVGKSEIIVMIILGIILSVNIISHEKKYMHENVKQPEVRANGLQL